jgi:hypothetical protein
MNTLINVVKILLSGRIYRRWYSLLPYSFSLLVMIGCAIHVHLFLETERGTEFASASGVLIVEYVFKGGAIAVVMILITWLVLKSVYKHAREVQGKPRHVLNYLSFSIAILIIGVAAIEVSVHLFQVTKVLKDEFFVSTVDSSMVDAAPVPGYYYDRELEEQNITVLPYGDRWSIKVNGAGRDSHLLHLHLVLVPDASHWDGFVSHRRELNRQETTRRQWIQQLAKKWMHENKELYCSVNEYSPTPKQYELYLSVRDFFALHLQNTGIVFEDVKVERVRM